MKGSGGRYRHDKEYNPSAAVHGESNRSCTHICLSIHNARAGAETRPITKSHPHQSHRIVATHGICTSTLRRQSCGFGAVHIAYHHPKHSQSIICHQCIAIPSTSITHHHHLKTPSRRIPLPLFHLLLHANVSLAYNQPPPHSPQEFNLPKPSWSHAAHACDSAGT